MRSCRLIVFALLGSLVCTQLTFSFDSSERDILASYFDQEEQIDHEKNLKVELQRFRDIEYTGHLYVGSQELPVIFDTGSVWSWLPAQTCSTCLDQGMIAYDPEISKSSKLVSDHVQVVKYG